MPTGKLKTLVHLSQPRRLPTNDKGYGIIEDAAGREVYFSHDVVESTFGIGDLRQGQQLEYTLENAPYLRAASVRLETADPLMA